MGEQPLFFGVLREGKIVFCYPPSQKAEHLAPVLHSVMLMARELEQGVNIIVARLGQRLFAVLNRGEAILFLSAPTSLSDDYIRELLSRVSERIENLAELLEGKDGITKRLEELIETAEDLDRVEESPLFQLYVVNPQNRHRILELGADCGAIISRVDPTTFVVELGQDKELLSSCIKQAYYRNIIRVLPQNIVLIITQLRIINYMLDIANAIVGKGIIKRILRALRDVLGEEFRVRFDPVPKIEWSFIDELKKDPDVLDRLDEGELLKVSVALKRFMEEFLNQMRETVGSKIVDRMLERAKSEVSRALPIVSFY